MFQFFRKRESRRQLAREPLLRPEEIEALMQGPVARQPSVVVLGDEDVVGFTPAPPPTPSPASPGR